MQDLLIYLLTNLVDNPDQVKVSQASDSTGLVTLSATVAPEDMGKVIGKGGKVINAIRQVVKIKAIKEGKRVQVTLSEPEGAPPKAKDTPPIPESKAEKPSDEVEAKPTAAKLKSSSTADSDSPQK